MNWLLIVVVGIILSGAFVGFVRGALRITVSLVATIVTLVVVVFVTPYVSDAIVALTPADEVIESECLNIIAKAMGGSSSTTKLTEEQVRKIMKGAGVSEEELAEKGIRVEDIVNGKISDKELAAIGISPNILDGHTVKKEDLYTIFNAEIPRQIQIEAIEKSGIPTAFKELLISNNNDEVYTKLGATTFAEYIGKYFSRILINICSFCLTFLVVTIVIRAIIFALDIVTSLPGLGLLNRMAGMVLGTGISFLIVEFLFVIITMIYTSRVGAQMLEMTEQSKLLTYFYENNVVMDLMTKLW